MQSWAKGFLQFCAREMLWKRMNAKNQASYTIVAQSFETAKKIEGWSWYLNISFATNFYDQRENALEH